MSVVKSRHLTYRTAVLLLVAVLGTAASVGAQGGASAGVTGVVADAQGGVLPGVTVTLRNTASGAERSTVTEATGEYRLLGLQPGQYDLNAELSGFAPRSVTGVTLTIGLSLTINMTLGLQGLSETLTVTAAAPIVETTTTSVATVVTQEQIEMLPIANRNAGTLALLLPGTQMPTGTRRARPTVGAGGANANLSTSYVDGGNNMLWTVGQEMLEAPQAAIREFRVNISGASAQYSAVGGVTLTATKSGTNEFHGEMFEFFRDTSLNAMDRFERESHDLRGAAKPEYRRDQFGFAGGGPILQDRLHFFGAYEGTREPKTATVRTGQPQFYSALEGNVPAGYKRRQLLARVDWQVSGDSNVFVRYLYDKEITFCESCGGTNAGNVGTDTDSPRDSLLVAYTTVIGSRMLNEVRSQLPKHSHLENLGSPPGIPRWPSSQRAQFPPERFKDYTGVLIFPSLTWGSTGYTNNNTERWDITDDFTFSATSHTFKAGGAFMRFHSTEESGHNVGTWTFGTDQFFDGTPASRARLTNPIQFTASFPPLPRRLRADWIYGYVQEELRVRSNVTIEAGLRYDLMYKAFNQAQSFEGREALRQLIDPTTRGDRNNVGPRLGLAWDVRKDGNTVVRAAAGKFYNTIFSGVLRNEVVTYLQRSVNLRNPTYPDPYGGRSPEQVATLSNNVSVADDEVEQPEAWTYGVGLSRALRPNLALHADVVYSHGTKANNTANINTPLNGVRPYPNWGIISQYRSQGESWYKALFLRLDRRYSNRYQYLVSYTFASDRDINAGQATVTDFYHQEYDEGWGSQDRRHTLVASGAYLLPMDVTVGAVWNYRSARPFSARAGVDLNADGANTDYVPGTTKNVFNRGNDDAMLALVNNWRASRGQAPIPASQIVTDEFQRVDVRVSKQIGLGGARRADVILQVFNLFGRDNYGSGALPWQMNATSNAFGTIATVNPRQQAELAVKFTW